MYIVTFLKWKQIQVIKMMSGNSRRGINKADNWRNHVEFPFQFFERTVNKRYFLKVLNLYKSVHRLNPQDWNQNDFFLLTIRWKVFMQQLHMTQFFKTLGKKLKLPIDFGPYDYLKIPCDLQFSIGVHNTHPYNCMLFILHKRVFIMPSW